MDSQYFPTQQYKLLINFVENISILRVLSSLVSDRL